MDFWKGGGDDEWDCALDLRRRAERTERKGGGGGGGEGSMMDLIDMLLYAI